jgi:hypothetical protein
MSYLLAYNVSGAISAPYPVGYTLTITLLTAVLTIYNYMFVGTSAGKLTARGEVNWKSNLAFYTVDVIAFGGVLGWGFLFIGLFSWAFAAYYNQFTTLSYNIPQEIMNLTLFGVFYGQLCAWRAAMLWSDLWEQHAAYTGKPEDPALKGQILPPSIRVRSNYAMNILPAMVIAAVCLFLGSFAYVQTLSSQTYCGNATCWTSTSIYYPVTQLCVASAVILATGTLLRLRYGQAASTTETGLFYAAEGTELNDPLIMGWFIIAYCFFLVTAVTLITHDIVKGLMAGTWWGLLPIFLTLLAQDTKYFYPYHVACVVTSLFVVYFASGVITPVGNTTLSNNTQVVGWGAFLTAPDTNANVNEDATWVNILSVGTFILTLLETLQDLSLLNGFRVSPTGVQVMEDVKGG